MQTYLVGGAVRDALLGLAVKDKDWVVVGATPEQMIAQGYSQVGSDFPVFLHPKSKQEYALARTERKSGMGYTGFVCHAAPDVTLEQDLMRRDLTINAIAQANDGSLIDPYNGQADIENKCYVMSRRPLLKTPYAYYVWLVLLPAFHTSVFMLLLKQWL